VTPYQRRVLAALRRAADYWNEPVSPFTVAHYVYAWGRDGDRIAAGVGAVTRALWRLRHAGKARTTECAGRIVWLPAAQESAAGA
jgi:hypothetical protein